MNEKIMVTKQKLLVARGNKFLSNNKKIGLPWDTRKNVVTSKKKTGSQMIKKLVHGNHKKYQIIWGKFRWRLNDLQKLIVHLKINHIQYSN